MSSAFAQKTTGKTAAPQGALPDDVLGQAVHPDVPKPMFELIELLFFAYRDFVGDADRLLETYDFGRAHHRVLHFVQRQPGLTIAELLDILRITKQSLNRVLKELVEQNYIAARPGETDRRQRHLFLTGSGEKLARELALLQSRRFDRALAALPEDGRQNAIKFLLAMIDEAERDKVSALIWGKTRA